MSFQERKQIQSWRLYRLKIYLILFPNIQRKVFNTASLHSLQIDDYRLRLYCYVRQHLENAPRHTVVDRRFRICSQIFSNRVNRCSMLGADYSVKDSRNNEIPSATYVQKHIPSKLVLSTILPITLDKCARKSETYFF